MTLTLYVRDSILNWLRSGSEVTNLGLVPGCATYHQHTIRFAVVENKTTDDGGDDNSSNIH